jgi:hypothetical protein
MGFMENVSSGVFFVLQFDKAIGNFVSFATASFRKSYWSLLFFDP